jgi:hypothetical protein
MQAAAPPGPAEQTIPGVFFERARLYGGRPYLHYFNIDHLLGERVGVVDRDEEPEDARLHREIGEEARQM